ncbi:MAG: hypothetical protein AAF591_11115 [Verrucomicrobiota bacterium]
MFLRIKTILIALLLCSTHTPAKAEEARQWVDHEGRSLVATLVSTGTHTVDLRRSDGSIVSVPINQLNEESRAYIEDWRARNPQAALDLPINPWPKTVSANSNGKIIARDHDPAAQSFSYRSKHFNLVSNIELPEKTAEDIATVFEATLAVLQQAPLGITVPPPSTHYRVELYDTQENYQRAGGTKGSGGQYHPGRNIMLLALDNLGIKNDGDELKLEHQNNAFVLKHEVTHQILNDYAANIPVWLSEGLAEYIAAAPYSDGNYRFHRMTENIFKYVNKWRFNEDHRQIPVVPLENLMQMSFSQWRMAIAGENPYTNYNSAALLAHHFLNNTPPNTPSPIARYLAALQKIHHPDPRTRRSKALALQNEILLQGRSYQQIQADMAQDWQKYQTSLVFE